MADNNSLVFYQQWAVAWLQMDKYSTNPWCVDSKNLDIFSDSQSVKGTAWSEPTQIEPVEWIDEDERGRFRLYEDGRVYDTEEQVWYDHDFYDDNAEYLQWRDKNIYGTQEFWTPRKLFVKYDWDDWSEIVILTDNLKYYIPHDWLHFNMVLQNKDNATSDAGVWDEGISYYIKVWTSWTAWSFNVSSKIAWGRLKFNLWKPYNNTSFTNWEVSVTQSAYIYRNSPTEALKGWGTINKTILWKFTFDAGTNSYTITDWSANPDKWNITINTTTWEIEIETFLSQYFWANMSWYEKWLHVWAKPDTNDAYLSFTWAYIKEYWDYLVPSEKEVMQLDDKYYVEIDDNEYQELEWLKQYDLDATGYWTLIWTWVFTIPEWKDIVAITKTFDYRLVFVNDDENEMWFVYLVPAWDDILTFSQGWEYPWMKFINATMINWYAYFIAENRWIRGLYIFYNWQTKKIVWADNKYTEWESIIDWKQIYNFTWPMINWRGHVVAPTVNWIYMYWENRYWQNVGSFILKVDWEINSMDAKNNELKVTYTEWANSYYKIYQDDINIRNYEQDWSITFPVQIGTHMLEKEIRDLELSYFLPNENTSFDVYVNINDYYFWTFTIENWPDLEVWDTVELKWAWNAELVFIEKNWNDYTFKLVWNMPYQTSTDKKIIVDSTEYEYTEMTHFKKIWSCMLSNDFMKWWKNRIFKITAENELPIVRKMQIRIDGHTDTHNSPLLYSVRLLSSQNDR